MIETGLGSHLSRCALLTTCHDPLMLTGRAGNLRCPVTSCFSRLGFVYCLHEAMSGEQVIITHPAIKPELAIQHLYRYSQGATSKKTRRIACAVPRTRSVHVPSAATRIQHTKESLRHKSLNNAVVMMKPFFVCFFAQEINSHTRHWRRASVGRPL